MVVSTADINNSGEADTFLAGVALFFVLKLTTSLDDIIWLSPFLAIADDGNDSNTNRNTNKTDSQCKGVTKIQCGLVYMAVCLLVTAEALIINLAAKYGLSALLGADSDDQYWNASRVLCAVASFIIAVFAFREFREWKEDRETNEASTVSVSGSEVDDNRYGTFIEEDPDKMKIESIVEVGKDDISVGKEAGQEKKISLGYLFMITFVGTLDDLALFSSVLIGKEISYSSLLTGSMVAACAILAASWCVARIGPFANAMQHIPVWAILLAVAIYMFITGMI